MSRRTCLQLAGLSTAGGLAGLSWGWTRTDDHREVNVVEEGADDSGSEPIDDVLADVVDDDTTVRFPEGTYRLESFRPGPLSNVALVGEDATIVPPEGSTEVVLGLLGRNLTVEGFRFDYTAPETAPQVIARCTDGLAIRDCTFDGVADVFGGRGRSAHEYHLMPAVTHPRGEGVVRNVSLADGSASPSNRGGIWVSDDSVGRLRFEGIELERWANNSLYVEESAGEVVVADSRFVNNDVGGPRLGAATAEVRDTTVVSDGWVPIQAFTGRRTSRGVWIDDDCERAVVDGCTFVMTGPYADDAIVYGDWTEQHPMVRRLAEAVDQVTDGTTITVRDCSFILREGLQAIRHRTRGASVTTENVNVRRNRP